MDGKSIIKSFGLSFYSFQFQGTKFVISQEAGVRKQFLVLNGEAVLGFIKKGDKFAECPSYTEVTSKLDCKVIIK